MAEETPVFDHVEIDHTLSDITFFDEAGQPLGPVQMAYLVDRTTGQITNWWFETPAAPTSEELPTVP
jgi:hypothetical protein